MENKTSALIALVMGLLVGLNWPKIRAFFARQKEALLSGKSTGLKEEEGEKKVAEPDEGRQVEEPKLPFEAAAVVATEEEQQPSEEEAPKEEEEPPEAGEEGQQPEEQPEGQPEGQQPEGVGSDQERKENWRLLKKRKKRR